VRISTNEAARYSTTRLWESAATEGSVEWTTDAVRQTFVDYFATAPRSHTYTPSSACAPLNDPTLLFTNAGMNQFKPIFLGQADPNSSLAKLSRAVNSQKCIRAGGKHNDLEDVGRDTYHHTFFEMLGSWSFGDYFKKEAIDYAWELLTDVYKLNPDRLYATYFEGNDDVAADLEARDFWLRYLPEERVIGCGAGDNFWEMGETGPCGPCSELHYDRIGNRDASALVNADDPDVIEIWNIVFIQYNRDGPNELQTLPAQHVDTGMGLERLVSILQDKSSNYDIDCFQAIMDKLETLTPKGPYTGKLGEEDTDRKDTAYRAIADHVRTLSFAIADGAVPNNEGRGYVLRRILRRATRYGQQVLGCETGFLTKLVPVVVQSFGKTYPELVQQEDTIQQIVAEEEQAFASMLERGIKFFDQLKDELNEKEIAQVPGEEAFYLYDTLGFPVDLTEQMAEEAGMTVDVPSFTQAMELQKQRSRQAQKTARLGDGVPTLELVAEQTAWLQDQKVLPTDDSFKYKWNVDLPATVMAIYTAEGFLDDATTAEEGDYVGIVVDKSTFYGEAGGQEADVGTLEIMDGDEVVGTIAVQDVQVYAGFLLHKGVVEKGSLTAHNVVNCKVDYDRRALVVPNHSMTHVLNAALRQVLGPDVDQRGSLCNDEKLRFDFSHKKAMTVKELTQVEQICQQVITNSEKVTSQIMPLSEATALEGVRAVFGEVYPDPVRVVSIGDDTSVEFCGGTHMDNTAEAEAFALVEESAVAKGIRRITAVTKDAAKQALAEGGRFAGLVTEAEALDAASVGLDKQAGALRKDLDAAFVSAAHKATLRNRIEGIQKKATDAKRKALQKRVDSVLNELKTDIEVAIADGKKSMVVAVDIGADSKASQRVMKTVQSVAPDMAFLGVTEEEPGSGGKIMAFAIVPDSLVDAGFKANEWVLAALETAGGRGGGKPGNAQGQAKECEDVQAVLDAAGAFATKAVNANVA
jgi:alanyl-tRNA synthetase